MASRDGALISTMDNALLDELNATANALVHAGKTPAEFTGILGAQITLLEQDCKRRVATKDGTRDGKWFTFDLKRAEDYVRVAKPNEVRFLSARIKGVVMSANFLKPGVYNHSNAHVAKALGILADLIENAPFSLGDRDGDLPLKG